MIKIKLLPRGKKHQVTYRIVVAEDRSKSDGKFIADLGFYTPQTKTLELNKESFADWQKKGAQVTEGVDKLLNPGKYPKKIKNVKEVKETKVEEPKAEEIKEEVKTTEEPKTE
ncbi:MAG: 30S ribosomal protein S16 [Candidatus Shapirobacteria bacterium]|nr:30S ribosomal protein S16 [Candidatus Shapirobacteria bacterium]